MTRAAPSLRLRAPRAVSRLALGVASAAAIAALVAMPAFAAAPAVYRNIPSTLPGNVASVGYQATSTSEFGDLIQLAAGSRSSGNLPVTVIMSIWACETGGDATCVTTPGATWSQPITLRIYAVDDSSGTAAPGTTLIDITRTFTLPYRPSFDPSGPCASSYGWYSASEEHCYRGLARPITFALPSGVTLPDRLIWSIAYNTQTHGYSPTGVAGPYNSLNVGATTFSGQPSVGSDVSPNAVFLNSTWSGAYGDNGAGGTGTFRLDPTGWGDNAPLVCIGTCPIDLANPTEIVGGETGNPNATPPPTGTGSDADGSSSPAAAIAICFAFGLAGVFVARRGHRSIGARES